MSSSLGLRLMEALLNLFFCVALTYGVLYGAYRYGVPNLGATRDFFEYEKMIEKPLDFDVVEAPFVIRQLPALVARGVLETGLYYPTLVAFSHFDRFDGEGTQRRFFSLIVSNYLAVVLALWLGLQEIGRRIPPARSTEAKLAFLMLSTGYFYFTVNVVAPMTEGYGWLGLTLFVIAGLHRSVGIVLLACLVVLFSRETALIFMGPFALVIAVATRTTAEDRRFWVKAASAATVALLSYLWIRNTWIEGNPAQVTLGAYTDHLGRSRLVGDFLFPALVAQADLLLILGLLVFRDRMTALAAVAGMVTLFAVGTTVGLMSNLGRVLGEPVPALALLAILGSITLRGANPDRVGAAERSDAQP